jgi:hypothetical protein
MKEKDNFFLHDIAFLENTFKNQENQFLYFTCIMDLITSSLNL